MAEDRQILLAADRWGLVRSAQNTPGNMHTVRALLLSVVISYVSIFPVSFRVTSLALGQSNGGDHMLVTITGTIRSTTMPSFLWDTVGMDDFDIGLFTFYIYREMHKPNVLVHNHPLTHTPPTQHPLPPRAPSHPTGQNPISQTFPNVFLCMQ